MDNVDNHHITINVDGIVEWIENNNIGLLDDGNMLIDHSGVGFTHIPPFNNFSLVFDNFFMDINFVSDDKELLKYICKISSYPIDISDFSGVVIGNCYVKLKNGDRVLLGSTYFFFPEKDDSFEIGINKELKQEIKDSLDGMLSKFATVYRRTVSLMHCKNIELKDEPLSRQQLRYRKRKNKIIYKVLAIKEGNKSTRYLENGHSGNKHAYHLCRGHFKTYTDDAPLFGKVTGTYWWPAYVRGSKDYGEVVKDYQVE